MIIKQINIKNFGKIENLNLNFKNGLNIIYGSNEAGKSTIQSFIKVMLYGMNSQKKSIKDNYRKKFAPWNGNLMSGDLSFEDYLKNNYNIKRSFGLTKKKDECLIFNSITGEEIKNINQSSPGIDIINLGEEAFENTVFIGQLNCKITKNDEIIKKLSNLQESGDENISYTKAVEKLKFIEKKITNVRNTGKLDKLKLKAFAIEDNINELKIIGEKKIKLKIKINELISKKSMIESDFERLDNFICKQLNSLNELKKYELINKSSEATERKIIELNSQIKNMSSILNNTDKIEEEIKELELELKNKLLNLEPLHRFEKVTNLITEKILGLEENLNNLNNRLTSIQSSNNAISRKKSLKTKLNTLNLATLFNCTILAISIIAGLFINSYLYYLSLILLMVLIYLIINRIKLKNCINKMEENVSKNDRAEDIQNEIKNIKSTLNSFYSDLNVVNYTEFINALNDYNNRKNAIDIIKVKIEEKEKAMNIEKTESIRKKILLYKDILNKILIEYGCSDTKELIGTLNTKRNELESINDEIKEKNYMIRNLYEKDENIDAIEESLEQINEKIKYYINILLSIDIAIKTFHEAFEEIQKNFGPKLNSKVGQILNEITLGKYEDLKISQNLDVKIIDNHEYKIKDMDYFSRGTCDQIYFSLRKGIADVIENNKDKLPLILDDAFVQYDDTRLESILNYLYKCSKEQQIILFTCQKRELNILHNKDNINFIYI